MLKNIWKEIDAYVHGVVGGWSHYIGMCFADGFHARMEDIAEEEQMGLVCEECAAEMELEVEVPLGGSKPIKDHGSN